MPGHPFKGGDMRSIGMIMHPDMKRFQINTPYLFTPPNPAKVDGASAATAAAFPSFGAFFSNYFGGKTYQFADGNCQKMLTGLKKCYETSTGAGSNPETSCAYFIDGFKRMSCNL